LECIDERRREPTYGDAAEVTRPCSVTVLIDSTQDIHVHCTRTPY
jgi:hypothetical protein